MATDEIMGIVSDLQPDELRAARDWIERMECSGRMESREAIRWKDAIFERMVTLGVDPDASPMQAGGPAPPDPIDRS